MFTRRYSIYNYSISHARVKFSREFNTTSMVNSEVSNLIKILIRSSRDDLVLLGLVCVCVPERDLNTEIVLHCKFSLN